ncbi:MAG: hypothetical protein H6741_00835 [Alphaproteobacteria bacterium]|nr:hypothetical protein [Alphaproteobacteria bacterium]MCB9791247.1 hypothetical protein [Alphaproteobacteria bacterium]
MKDTQTDAAAEEAIEEAIRLVADSVGDLMEFWNFKPSMGKVWTVLYLSQEPLSADDIVHRTGLSAGSVSMTLNELRTWGVVHKVRRPGERRRLYEPETDIWSMVTHVFRERELKVVRSAIESFAAAARLLDEHSISGDPRTTLRGRFVATRVRLLLDLSHTGERLLERLASSGELDLTPLRGWLQRVRRRSAVRP